MPRSAPGPSCPRCGGPRNSETCYVNKKSSDGLQTLCKVCDNFTRRIRYTLPPRKGKIPCTLCADLSHRVVGKTCSVCGRRYAPLPPVRVDAERRGASAWAMAMNEGAMELT